jgi:glycerol-3-phosphate dehydrogenase (NAD(P)+)
VAGLGGALDNVPAIAAGSATTRAASVTRGPAEMARLGVSMGAQERTSTGLPGALDPVLIWTDRALRRNGSYSIDCSIRALAHMAVLLNRQ